MNRILRVLAALLVALACAAGARAQDAPGVLSTGRTRVSVVLESTKAEVGERIPARIVVTSTDQPEKIELSIPDEMSTTAYIEPVEFDGHDFRTGVRPLKDGTLAIGPVKAKLGFADGHTEEVEAGVLGLEVAPPVVPEGETRDLTEPVELPFDWTWRNLAIAAAIILLLAAIGLIGWALTRRKSAPAATPEPVVLPPLEEARLALDDLATMKLFRAVGPEQHYTALSMLMRRYLEREFRIPALEMTDDEIVRFVRRDLANHSGTAPLPDLFTRTVMAKFARLELTQEIASSDCAVAGQFLDAEESRKQRERAAIESQARKQRPPEAAAVTDIGFRFAHPWVLSALALVPIALWLHVRARRQGTPAIVFSDLGFLSDMRPTWRQRVDSAMPAVRALVVALGIAALARPQLGTVERSVRTLGVDIALAIDVSGSMQAIDLQPNRLEAAKEAATSFVRARESDRLSVVLFGKSGGVLCPPTLDRDVVVSFIESIENGIINGDMTAIGTGLGMAVERLSNSEARSRVVILLTDGVNNSGQIGPLQAAEAAKALAIKVYTIGIGGEGPAIVPRTTPRGIVGYQQIAADVDERTLTQIAEMTGGRYFRARDTEGLKNIYAEIDKLEKTELEVDETSDYEERFYLIWGPALLLLGLEVLFRAFVLRRLP